MPMSPASLRLPSSCAVVGCNGAIGAAITAQLLDHEVAVHGFDITENTEHSLASFTDVPSDDPEESIETFASRVRQTNPAALVVASGIYPARPIAAETCGSLSRILEINAVVPAMLARAFIVNTEDSGTTIVVTSSLAAARSRVGTAAYSASKVALESLMRALALEYRDQQARINMVRPGYITSNSRMNPIPAAYDQRMKSSGYSSTPDDLVNTYLWLLSDNSRQINGSVIEVDRGMRLGSTTETAWLG